MKNLDALQTYMQEKSYNYKDIENLAFLAQGGQSYVLRAELFIPVEAVVKTIIPNKKEKEQTQAAMLDILEESHMIKLLTNKECVVNVLEEIIEYNKEQNSVENYLSIVE